MTIPSARLRRIAAIGALALFIIAPGPSNPAPPDQPGPGRDTIETELDAIRKRMSEERRTLAQVMKKQGGLLEKLHALKAQIKRSQDRLERLAAESAVLEQEAHELTRQMDDIGERVTAKRQMMARRVRARYRFGRLGLATVLFGAENVADMSRRRKYLEALFRSDRDRIHEYNALLVEWQEAGQRVEERRGRIAGLEELARAERQNLEHEKASLDEMIRQVREEKQAHEQMLRELTANESRLSGLIDRIDRQNAPPAEPEPPADASPPGPEPDRPDPPPVSPKLEPPPPGAGFGSLQGRLCAPAPGPVVSTYGKKIHPEFNTVTMQNGIEIGAPAGAPAKVVADGVVRFAQWFKGYGNLVIVDHGDGWFTVYAHLQNLAVSVGQAVTRGESLGEVGDTGSMEGASLYFEVRHHKQAYDPQAWLGGCSL